MAKKNRGRSNKPAKGFIVRGKGQITTALSTTSAAAGFVITRVNITTEGFNSLIQLGTVFAKWKLLRMSFHFVPIKPTSTEGTVGIAYLPDVVATIPSSTTTALSQKFSTYGPIWKPLTLRARTQHQGWSYTRENAAYDDRLEAFGSVVLWTDLTAAAYIPGVLYMQYVAMFDDVGNSTILPSQVGQLESKEEEEDASVQVSMDKPQKLKTQKIPQYQTVEQNEVLSRQSMEDTIQNLALQIEALRTIIDSRSPSK